MIPAPLVFLLAAGALVCMAASLVIVISDESVIADEGRRVESKGDAS